MRAVRQIVVALIGFALALVPLGGLAKMEPPQHEMSAGAQEDACPRCATAPGSGVQACALKCCITAAILIELQPPAGARITTVADTTAAALSPFARPPDPPPPRS